MTFIEIYSLSFVVILGMIAFVWLISVCIVNASIVDIFWGIGFIILTWFYFFNTNGFLTRKWLISALVTIWGVRLSLYLFWRNWGKGEDFRYRKFRTDYGEHRYWWISFFQVYLFQGILMILVAAPLLGAQYSQDKTLNILDYLGILLWCIGFLFEAGGDLQLAIFKADPENKGKLLTQGLWRYTRHPNYFGDACIWWGYGCICAAAGSFIPIGGSVLMTLLLLYISGVAFLERTLIKDKKDYKDYIKSTPAFFPGNPKKI